MTRPNGSSQSIGNSSAERALEELVLGRAPDLAHELDEAAGLAQQRVDDLAEVAALLGIDLGGDLQRDAGSPRDLDRAVEPLLGRDPAEEREILAGLPRKAWSAARQPVMDGARASSRAGSGARCESEIETSGISG